MKDTIFIKLRGNFVVWFAFAVLSATTLAASLVWPQWIEMLFGNQPDAGDGVEEWAITGVLTAMTLIVGAAAACSWRTRSTSSGKNQ
ncbi:hypothetical protein [Paraburkholderia sp. MM5477-R1]|uniref:hypothetical protein n=1 Tax=Paraburkholderia sp. MM5477-R1 TaxID=2991062 RepID=UPI003D1B11FA